jgi:anthranilate synthase component 2
MKKILVIDNYDSFVYNLVHNLETLNCDVTVRRNNQFDMDEISSYDKLLLSPGPGIPNEAGQLMEIIKVYASSIPILGVCLGQQAIGEVFGANLENLKQVYHGIASKATIIVDDEPLFKELSKNIEIGRYHSWVVSRNNFPETLEITSVDENGFIMSLRHKNFDVRGIQFHPESILTPMGEKIIKNWIES